MSLIDLKHGNPVAKITDLNLDSSLSSSILAELPYYDEYYAIEGPNQFVKGYIQEFVKDPYMDLKPIKEFRLLSIPDQIPALDLEQVVHEYRLPIITRTKKKDCLHRFEYILNTQGKPTRLRSIEINLSKWNFSAPDKHVRLMQADDIEELRELFRQQYSLRYRAVPQLYKSCPAACFVYEAGHQILGATFNKVEEKALYMRQIFVREGYRDLGIGHKLYVARLSFAKNNGLEKAYGHIRLESLAFHSHYAQAGPGREFYVIRR